MIKILKRSRIKSLKSTIIHIFTVFLILCGFLLLNSCGAFEEEQVNNPKVTIETTTSITNFVTTAETTPVETRPEKVTFPICGKVKLSNQFDWLNIRSGPGTSYPMMGKLAPDTVITLTGEQSNFYVLDFLGSQSYVSKDYIVIDRSHEPFSTELYAHVTSELVMSTDEQKKEVELLDTLVDIRTVDPTIQTNIIFATDQNFTGKVQYPLNICIIQKDTAEKLKVAQELFQKDGYSILIYDAYRPYSVSVALAEIEKNPIYIADPINNPSRHNRGASIDMSLVDSTGKEIEMPSPMHTFDQTSRRSNPGMSEEARRNMDYMTDIMIQCGFVKYEWEWWHFNDDNCYDYPVTDHYYYDFIFSNSID
ncbi:MAG TPA: hypothetical protein DDZ89_01115 [Clostridiales bacterium]|nr:hypothetical protein [Clostridiales bacterium]